MRPERLLLARSMRGRAAGRVPRGQVRRSPVRRGPVQPGPVQPGPVRRGVPCRPGVSVLAAVAVALGAPTGCAAPAIVPRPLDAAHAAPAGPDGPEGPRARPGVHRGARAGAGRSASEPSPPLPLRARGTSAAGREAFAEHVVAVLNHTARSLDPEALLEVSSPQCTACAAVADYVNRIAVTGGRIEGGSWRVVDAIALDTRSAARRQVTVAVECRPEALYLRRGSEPVHFDAGRTVFTFDITRRARRWVLLEIRGAQG